MKEPAKNPPTFRALFPDLSEEQLQEVEETLYRYCEIVLRISDRLYRENQDRTFDGGGSPP